MAPPYSPTSLTKTGIGQWVLTGSNSYSGNTNVAGGTLTIALSSALSSNTNLVIGNGASVVANNGGAAKLTLQAQSIATSGTGNFDLQNNSLVLHNTSIGAVNALVATGFSAGSWNGPGITSSTAANDTTHLTAVGVATGLISFEGATVSPADVLVKYTYYGDANLDGQVDGSDYSRIDNGYESQLTGWLNGDFNYDGVVNGSDYTLIDNAFNSQGVQISAEVAAPTAQIANATSAVPEPTSLGLLGIGALSLLGRRRRSTRLMKAK